MEMYTNKWLYCLNKITFVEIYKIYIVKLLLRLNELIHLHKASLLYYAHRYIETIKNENHQNSSNCYKLHNLKMFKERIVNIIKELVNNCVYTRNMREIFVQIS